MTQLNKLFSSLCILLTFAGFMVTAEAFSDGFILFGAYSGKATYLLDSNMNTITTWDHSKLSDSLNGYSAYLLPNGNLLRSGQVKAVMKGTTQVSPPANAAPLQGTIDEIDAHGKVVWSYQLADSIYMLHHDFKILPNGNILAVSFVRYSRAQMIAAGVDSTIKDNGAKAKAMLGEKIIEIKPDHEKGGGTIVWEWVMLDHVAPKEQAMGNPHLISGSIVKELYTGQWVHLNGMDYDSIKDLIVFSSRIFSEVYVIDHSTTTQEAKGHTGGKFGKGGDILYRWGRSKNYLENGDTAVRVLHCPTWIPKGYPGEGHILFFHNNVNGNNPRGISQVIEIIPPFDANGKFTYTTGSAFGPVSPIWIYSPSSDFRSDYMSSTFRLPNGNTLIHEAYPGGTGGFGASSNSRIREISPNKTIIDTASLVIKNNSSGFGMAFNPAKIMYYPSSYPGINKLFLALNISNTSKGQQIDVKKQLPKVTLTKDAAVFTNISGCEVSFFALSGKKIASMRVKSSKFTYNVSHFPVGVYIVKVISKKEILTSSMFTILP